MLRRREPAVNNRALSPQVASCRGPHYNRIPAVVSISNYKEPLRCSVQFSDVLVGKVWLCSGQSNMAMSVGGVANKDAEIAWANNPDCNLVNKAGWPASLFRTDDWAQ